MPDFKIILVEPEYELNLGYAARVLKNFGETQMHIVNPKVKAGKDAVKFSKHARDLLESAKIYKSLKAATRDCDFIVGTSGVLIRSKETLRSPLTLRQFIQKVKGKRGRFAILIGREGIGLNTAELKQCDFIFTIPASEEYPILNVTHAMAIILYELSALKAARRKQALIPTADKREKEQLLWLFNSLVDSVNKDMRNPEKAKLAFKRILGRSVVGDLEASAMLGVFSRLRKRIKKN